MKDALFTDSMIQLILDTLLIAQDQQIGMKIAERIAGNQLLFKVSKKVNFSKITVVMNL